MYMEKQPLTQKLFTRGVKEIITRDELKERLSNGKKLIIKLGIDATSPDLHIGHAASLWKIKELQKAGHKAVIILGDFTTSIGDPTGKSKTRPVLGKKEIDAHISSIQKQVKSILLSDSRALEFRRNSEWFSRMKTGEFLGLMSRITHARLIERDMFQERIQNKSEIFMHELIYPILQGYDSVKIESDITIIGHDQLFNEHMGRFFQEQFGQPPQIIVALTILPGMHGGEKMSKSLGNAILLSDSPRDKFGKAMSIIDELIIPYLTMYTEVSIETIQSLENNLKEGKNPRDAKIIFARALVERYHGKKSADEEQKRFLATFSQRKSLSATIPVSLEYGIKNIIALLIELELASSKQDARRLIHQGAVEVDGEVVRDVHKEYRISQGTIIRAGKHKIVDVK